jgi:hypothetical protein
MFETLIERLNNFFYKEPLAERRSEFKHDAIRYLKKHKKKLSVLTREEKDFFLNIGGAIYSTRYRGLSTDYIGSDFYEDFGQYMGNYMPPSDVAEFFKSSKIPDLNVLVLANEDSEEPAITFSENFKYAMYRCTYSKTKVHARKAHTEA